MIENFQLNKKKIEKSANADFSHHVWMDCAVVGIVACFSESVAECMFRGHQRVRVGEESNSPSDWPPEPEVTVCGVESSLVQVTMSPVLISAGFGSNAVSVRPVVPVDSACAPRLSWLTGPKTTNPASRTPAAIPAMTGLSLPVLNGSNIKKFLLFSCLVF